jgi:hypothetical protein
MTKTYCCSEFETEFEHGLLLQYRSNPDYGSVGYFFEYDCDESGIYEDTQIIKFCPWCGSKISNYK